MTVKRFLFTSTYTPTQNPETGIVYVCKAYERIDLICPCGCKQVVTLNTIAETSPSWKYDKDTKTITPSIHRTVGCRSHFSITHGLVVNQKIKQ